jgi:hypothetical protein
MPEMCRAINSVEMSPMMASDASLADEMCKEEALRKKMMEEYYLF